MVTDLVTRARNGDKQAWDALVERYAPLVWSICRRHQLGDADAERRRPERLAAASEPAGHDPRSGRASRLAGHHHPPGMRPGPARSAGTARCRVRAGRRDIPDEQAAMAEQELLAAERHAALREAFAHLPPCCQQLITMLIEDPPVPYAEISARLGIPVGSIGPTRGRCLDKLRRYPAIAALINADPQTTGAVRSSQLR